MDELLNAIKSICNTIMRFSTLVVCTVYTVSMNHRDGKLVFLLIFEKHEVLKKKSLLMSTQKYKTRITHYQKASAYNNGFHTDI